MLVHTDGKGIEKITEKGIVANGKEYELDCIIYSTGFEVGTSYQRRSNFTMKGRNGVLLDEAWKDGPKTLHGFHTPDFPNMFLISTMHSGFAANFTHMCTYIFSKSIHLLPSLNLDGQGHGRQGRGIKEQIRRNVHR